MLRLLAGQVVVFVIAFFGMGVLFQAAGGFLRGDGRQNQRIGGTEYDCTAQNTDDFGPETAAPLFGQKNISL